MTDTTARASACLITFNMLPSLTLHPEHAADLNPPEGLDHPDPEVQKNLHRRWSARLLAHLDADSAPVTDLSQPALPLALLEPAAMQALVRDLGIALLGAALRRIVERRAVLNARASLGLSGMKWALHEAARLHPGLQDIRVWTLRVHGDSDAFTNWAGLADLLGAGLLAQAWHDAPTSLRRRANWKLPPPSLDAECRNASGLTEPAARALCLQHLTKIDPVWQSSFT